MTALTPRRSRRGFTLIEMMVVVGILILLATLAVAFVPRVQEKERPRRAADQLQGWLLITKQWAKRDRAPRGLRLFRPADNNVVELAYLEQPPDFVVKPGVTTTNSSVRGITFTAGTAAVGLEPAQLGWTKPVFDFSGGFGTDTTSWPVQVNDYLEVDDGGTNASQVFRVTGLSSATALALDRDPGITATKTTYRFIRQPRERAGEARLQMPASTIIDLNTNATYSNTIPGGSVLDIVFAPSGSQTGWTGAADRIQLWVRDQTADDTNPPTQGNLITIYVRTGLIAAHPVDPSGDPYSYTRDGRGSGL
jgi:prepilin-type N-terminal cleavage/methylation domain-containing protein